jgi:ferredoxin-NADP reductase
LKLIKQRAKKVSQFFPNLYIVLHNIVNRLIRMQHLQASVRTAFRSRVLKVNKIAKDVISMAIQTPHEFRFLPGQWIDVMIAKDDELALKQLDPNYAPNKSVKDFSVEMRDDPNNRDDIYNVTGFSMTSSPFRYDEIHLGIKLTDHPITRFIHTHVKEGHMLNVAGPDGIFKLPDLHELQHKYNGQVVLIAAGIGITPILSMLRYAHHVNESDETLNATLLHSSKTVEDLYFKDDVVQLCERRGLHAHLFATKKHEKDVQLGERVQLHCARIDGEAISKYIPDDAIKHGLFMLCGPQPFISGIEELLNDKGVPMDRVVYEKWW